jgi:hypothetical protein
VSWPETDGTDDLDALLEAARVRRLLRPPPGQGGVAAFLAGFLAGPAEPRRLPEGALASVPPGEAERERARLTVALTSLRNEVEGVMPKKKARIGRPPEFRDRVRLTVLLERRELAALHKLAATLDMSASAYVRQFIQSTIHHMVVDREEKR